jgi:hypothetical protein
MGFAQAQQLGRISESNAKSACSSRLTISLRLSEIDDSQPQSHSHIAQNSLVKMLENKF